VIVVRGRRLCAGCLGLGVGCGLSIPLTPLVLLALNYELGSVLLLAGLLVVCTTLIGSVYGTAGVRCHVLLNALLPLSFLLITMGALNVSGEFINGLWAILLGLLWIETRKVTSQDRHAAICSECPSPCKSFSR
jgi:hypothetical protein